ncbi:MAG: glycoside hydrolase family 30 protein [Bacteroidota bacterium]|nr:glycoside hydrolase family 30 protein [Bacteroidota bacterium]
MKKTLIALMLVITAFTAQSQTKIKATAAQPAPKIKTVKVYTTDSSKYRLALTDDLQFIDFKQPLETDICIFVDPTKKYQTLLGIGGALTDASAETYARLPKDKQEELMRAYYDKVKGIGYTLGRTNMNSCDFSSDSYTYVAENDKSLNTFDIKHDQQFRIPFIKDAIKAAGGKLNLFISPWSPPAWMKDNNDMLHGGKLKSEYYQTWANYFVKYIRAYEKNGIPIWGLTIQNEPMAKQKWESCIYTANDEKEFLKKYLGPTLQKEQLGNKKIMIWDHNRDMINQRANEILNDKEAAKYVWGLGFHWYEDWSGGERMYANVGIVKESFPNIHLVLTEGCLGPFSTARLTDWKLGESYGSSMIHDFNNGTEGWTDWNVLLDEKGGPNHVQNYCFAPIHADTRTGQLTYTNEYYYIGHFSKYIQPGARRINSAASRSVLQTTAFLNPDGTIAVVVMNTCNQKVPYYLWIDKKAVSVTSLPRSIATLVVE